MKEQNKIVKFLIEYGVYIVLFIISAFCIIMGYSSDYSCDKSDTPDYVVEIKENTNQETDVQTKNIYVISKKSDSESEIPKNVGFSLLASAIAALILDTSITRKHSKKDRIDKTRLLSDLKYECEDILSELVLATQECFGIDDDKRTYSEWIIMLFGSEESIEKNESGIKDFVRKIVELEKCAKKTLDLCKLNYNNNEITETIEKNIKDIIGKCFCIRNWSNSKEHQMFLIDSFEKLKNSIIKLFPELKEQFNIQFNHDDLSRW